MAKGKASKIELSGEERSELESLARRRSTGQALALRSRIVLAAAEGVHNGLIAERLGIFRGTVGKWRERFALERLAGLYDEPRPGAPRQIGDDEIAETIRRTLETRPAGATHWSLRSMAEAVGHAPSTIHRIWKAFGLQPQRDVQAVERSAVRSRKCATLSDCISTHRIVRWCCVSMKSHRFRRSTGPSRYCRCGRGKPSGAHTIINGMARSRCSLPLTCRSGR